MSLYINCIQTSGFYYVIQVREKISDGHCEITTQLPPTHTTRTDIYHTTNLFYLPIVHTAL